MAWNFLDQGDDDFRREKVREALQTYEQIITANDQPPGNALLYTLPKLTVASTHAKTVIANLGAVDSLQVNPAISEVILHARWQLGKIKQGLNFFGGEAHYYPVFSFEYLQSVARHLAQMAIQSERDYIAFRTSGERERLGKAQLENAAELATKEVDVALEQWWVAYRGLEVADAAYNQANTRLQNANDERNDFANVGWDRAIYDTVQAWTSAAPGAKDVKFTVHGWDGEDRVFKGKSSEVIKQVTWERGQMNYYYQLRQMDRQITELEAALQVADRQKAEAYHRSEVGRLQYEMSTMRKRHADELLATYNSNIFGFELWFAMAEQMRRISQNYLFWAIEIAKQMERAYEYETDQPLRLIQDDYRSSFPEVANAGLLAGDLMLRDIEYFTVHRILTTQRKRQPIKRVLSLRQQSPFAFDQLKKTGHCSFETTMEDFILLHPGTFLHKISAVEVIVEGLLPLEGIFGTLKNRGYSLIRKGNGDVVIKIQPAETLILSNFMLKGDAYIFRPSPDILGIFEDSGASTSWELDFPLTSNNVNMDNVFDVKVVVYYDAFHSRLLEAQDLASVSPEGESTAFFSANIQFPDQFFQFQDTGELQVSLAATDFPYNELNPELLNIGFGFSGKPGVSVQGITIHVQIDSVAGEAVIATDARGAAVSDPNNAANPLNIFNGQPAVNTYHLTLRMNENPALTRVNEEGQTVWDLPDKIRDAVIFFEYRFQRRGV